MTPTFLQLLHLEGCGLGLLQAFHHQEGKACLRVVPAEEAKPRNAAKNWGLINVI